MQQLEQQQKCKDLQDENEDMKAEILDLKRASGPPNGSVSPPAIVKSASMLNGNEKEGRNTSVSENQRGKVCMPLTPDVDIMMTRTCGNIAACDTIPSWQGMANLAHNQMTIAAPVGLYTIRRS